jgi:hypothetical protein
MLEIASGDHFIVFHSTEQSQLYAISWLIFMPQQMISVTEEYAFNHGTLSQGAYAVLRTSMSP